MNSTFFAFCGAVLGILTVGLGAFGAHALKSILSEYSKSIWDKAVFYQAIHAVVLLVLPSLDKYISPRNINISGLLILSGVFLFSGSLFLLAITGKKYLGAITPIGGVLFIAGWSWLAVNLFKVAFKS